MITSVEVGTRRLRSYLRRLSLRRKNKIVTADDASRFLTTREGVNDSTERLRITNSVLNIYNDEFARVGSRPSSRPEMKGYNLTEWMYVGD